MFGFFKTMDTTGIFLSSAINLNNSSESAANACRYYGTFKSQKFGDLYWKTYAEEKALILIDQDVTVSACLRYRLKHTVVISSRKFTIAPNFLVHRANGQIEVILVEDDYRLTNQHYAAALAVLHQTIAKQSNSRLSIVTDAGFNRLLYATAQLVVVDKNLSPCIFCAARPAAPRPNTLTKILFDILFCESTGRLSVKQITARAKSVDKTVKEKTILGILYFNAQQGRYFLRAGKGTFELLPDFRCVQHGANNL